MTSKEMNWIRRELIRAQMIVSSPAGTWRNSTVEIASAIVRQWGMPTIKDVHHE